MISDFYNVQSPFEEVSFFNSIQVNNLQTPDLYRRSYSQNKLIPVIARLNELRLQHNVEKEIFMTLCDRIEKFVDAMGWAMDGDFGEHFFFDEYVDNSITVKFKKRADVRLSIFFDDEDVDCEDVILSYQGQQRRELFCGSVNRAVEILYRELDYET